MPQMTRPVAPLDSQPRWPDGYIVALSSECQARYSPRQNLAYG